MNYLNYFDYLLVKITKIKFIPILFINNQMVVKSNL